MRVRGSWSSVLHRCWGSVNRGHAWKVYISTPECINGILTMAILHLHNAETESNETVRTSVLFSVMVASRMCTWFARQNSAEVTRTRCPVKRGVGILLNLLIHILCPAAGLWMTKTSIHDAVRYNKGEDGLPKCLPNTVELSRPFAAMILVADDNKGQVWQSRRITCMHPLLLPRRKTPIIRISRYDVAVQ